MRSSNLTSEYLIKTDERKANMEPRHCVLHLAILQYFCRERRGGLTIIAGEMSFLAMKTRSIRLFLFRTIPAARLWLRIRFCTVTCSIIGTAFSLWSTVLFRAIGITCSGASLSTLMHGGINALDNVITLSATCVPPHFLSQSR